MVLGNDFFPLRHCLMALNMPGVFWFFYIHSNLVKKKFACDLMCLGRCHLFLGLPLAYCVFVIHFKVVHKFFACIWLSVLYTINWILFTLVYFEGVRAPSEACGWRFQRSTCAGRGEPVTRQDPHFLWKACSSHGHRCHRSSIQTWTSA